jgi:3-hydroxyacyl-CoA dehydrogenase
MAEEQRARIAIVGAGFVGRSWATLFARHGHRVTLHDSDANALTSVHSWIRGALDQFAEAGLAGDCLDTILDRVAVGADLEAAVAEADYVQENVPERRDVKLALFTELDRFAPKTAILASSSSSLTCTQICEGIPSRARCLVAHPANPPHLLPAVEVAPAAFTDPAVTERAVAILRGAGQVPVIIGEVDGFVMNRLQAAIVREALALVESGIAEPRAIDDIVKHSLGMRWSFMGPFETMDLNAPNGFGDYAQRYGSAFARLFGEVGWSAGAVAQVDEAMRAECPLGAMDEKRRWRDRRLAALIDHMARQPG